MPSDYVFSWNFGIQKLHIVNQVISSTFIGHYYTRGWEKLGTGSVPDSLQDFIIPLGRTDGATSIGNAAPGSDELTRYELDLNSFIQEKTLIMYADDGILNDVVDTVDDIIDKTGTAGFFFVIGFNTVIWWGKTGIYVLRVFTSLKSVYKDLFDW